MKDGCIVSFGILFPLLLQLLGWMHRKLRQNSGEALKEFGIGQPSLDDQQYYNYPKPNHCSRPLTKTQPRNSIASVEATRADDEDLGEESSAYSDLFDGFLAIGTLGSDPVITDPSTPTFSFSVENITEKETEVTETELRVINEELEKVLGDDESSGRNSYVSTGRSSHGSTITLSVKPMEGAEGTNGNGTVTCPLQGYLFGTSIGVSKTTVPKKENRTSLGELFQKTKMAEENSGTKYERGEKRTEKESDKSAVQLMKKILKKKTVHASSRSSTTASGGLVDSASAEKKMHKILHMFHRKVHPERSVTTGKSDKFPENEEGCNDGNRMSAGDCITIIPHRTLSRKTTGHVKSLVNLSGGDSNGNREHWIKTDADYLVLEL